MVAPPSNSICINLVIIYLPKKTSILSNFLNWRNHPSSNTIKKSNTFQFYSVLSLTLSQSSWWIKATGIHGNYIDLTCPKKHKPPRTPSLSPPPVLLPQIRYSLLRPLQLTNQFQFLTNLIHIPKKKKKKPQLKL